MCGVEISDLPYLALGNNSNIASEDMADIQRQGVAFDDDNKTDPKNYFPPKKTLTQLE